MRSAVTLASAASQRAVFVVIVNYRTGPMVVECLASLEPQRAALRGGRVMVVDNASGDDSVALIREAIERHGYGDWCEVLAMPRNGGFAYGNNAGISRVRQLDPGFGTVVLLNPDTLAKPDLIDALVGFLDANPKVGVAGASIENMNGLPELSSHRDPSPLGEFDGAAELGWLSRLLARYPLDGPRADAHACDWVSGACMAVRRDVLDAVGALDEEFFLYFEEVDYCVRARRLGWSCWFVPQARVVHFEGAATGIRVARRRRPTYWYASRRRFFVKRYGILGLLGSDVLWAIGRLSLVTRRILRLGGRSNVNDEPTHVAQDLLFGDLKALFSGELGRIRQHG